MPSILLISDDPALRQTLADQLEYHQEFACTASSSGQPALDLVETGGFDAILLDIHRLRAEERTRCRQLRRLAGDVPIVLLTAGSDDPLLDCRVDAQVARPFRLNDLLRQLRMCIQASSKNNDVLVFGSTTGAGRYRLRPQVKLVIGPDGRRVRLTEKETAILAFLHRACGRTIDRGTLLSAVWGYRSAVATHTLETHIYRLRRKIEPDPTRAEILVTEAGGYRLIS